MDDQATKRCARCKVELLVSAFARKRRGDYQPYRPCQAAYKQEHYAKNKARYVKATKRRRDALLAEVRRLKAGPCADCGIQYPHYVMDFDHREGEIKVGNVRTLIVRKGSLQRAMAEVAKCDVVCANCHGERTFQRRLQARSEAVKRDRKPLL